MVLPCFFVDQNMEAVLLHITIGTCTLFNQAPCLLPLLQRSARSWLRIAAQLALCESVVAASGSSCIEPTAEAATLALCPLNRLAKATLTTTTRPSSISPSYRELMMCHSQVSVPAQRR